MRRATLVLLAVFGALLSQAAQAAVIIDNFSTAPRPEIFGSEIATGGGVCCFATQWFTSDRGDPSVVAFSRRNNLNSGYIKGTRWIAGRDSRGRTLREFATAIPEPGSLVLFAIGLGLVRVMRR